VKSQSDYPKGEKPVPLLNKVLWLTQRTKPSTQEEFQEDHCGVKR